MTTQRKPSEGSSPRMQPLSRLPVFYALRGRRVVVAGGTAAAAWKAELLSAAGACVDVYVRTMSTELKELTGDPPGGAITVHGRSIEAADLAGAAMAVGAFDDECEAAAFRDLARPYGVPVNVIDKPAFCDFSFGAIVNRSPLVVGISTDGAAPVFAQAIRVRIEGLIPRGFARWAKAAGEWRKAVVSSGFSARARTRFWQLFAARALENPDRPPGDADFAQLISTTRDSGAAAERGSVTLVGAGPGDPELLTLRAVRALQSADVILIDDLVAPAVLDFARREAKKMIVGKTGRAPSCRQNDINALMVSLARRGRRVVRLKGGDPLIFARADEEIAACRAAGVAVEVVPGISAAQGAASRMAVSLTKRRVARRIQFISGHAVGGALPADIDWKGLADPSTTTVVYMPAGTLAELVTRAVEEGLDPGMPAVAVIGATRPDERIVAASIATLPERLATDPPHGPVLVMLGRGLTDYVESALATALNNAISEATMNLSKCKLA